MSKNKSDIRVISDKEDIIEELELLYLDDLVDDLNILDNKSTFIMIEKMLSFADIPTFGKTVYSAKEKKEKNAFSLTKIKRRVSKNKLFYFDEQYMINFEKNNRKFFCETKQSNIYMPPQFYQFLNIKNKKFNLNDGNYKTYLINKTIKKYFNREMTNILFKSFNRVECAKNIEINNEKYKRIDLHVAKHGVGIKQDSFFHNLRGNVFAKDKICVLIKNKKDNFEIYIALFRNPIYFFKTNQTSDEQLLNVSREICPELISQDISRRNQTRWRNSLAEYSLSLNNDNNTVRCPFSNIAIQYPNEATLFRASHIKAYSKCDSIAEAFDINNGFLLCANADALFDKYLISVNPRNGQIVYSHQISDSLKKALSFEEKIDKNYLNDDRIKYLEFHYNIFLEREKIG